MLRNFGYWNIALCLASGALTSCGEPSLQPQAALPVEVPASEGPFLKPGMQEKNFTGYLILWDEAVEPDGMAGVLEAVFEDRKAKEQALLHKDSNLRVAEDALEEARLRAQVHEAELQELYGNTEALFEARRLTAATYFEEQLAALARDGESFGEEEWVRARQNFAFYCEAKLWELAASRLLQSPLSRRPTPLLLCEEYYKERGYFEFGTGEDAASACGGTVQLYQDCLWLHGVFKSQLYASFYVENCSSRDPRPKQQVLSDWLESGLLTQALTHPEFGRQFRSSMLRRSRLPFAMRALSADFESCANVFRLPSELRGGAGKEVQEPQKLIDDVEGLDVAQRKFGLLPSGETINEDVRRWHLLSQPIALLAARNADAASVSDELWLKAEDLALASPSSEARANAQVEARLQGFFAGFEQLLPQSALQRRQELDNEVEASVGHLDAMREIAEVHFGLVSRWLGTGAEQARVPGVASIFETMTLRLSAADSGFRVAFGIGSDVTDVDDWRFEPTSNQLEFTFETSEPALIGLRQRERLEGDPYFNDVEWSALQGVSVMLHVKFVFGRLGEQMSVATAEIELQSPVLGQRFGAITADTYSQSLRESETR